MTERSLSSFDRKEHLQYLSEQYYDLLVIGGGITGAGIALDAASRGLSVALVEKEDFAWGTSSRSTKLIHGGLRYLKQLQVGLVREVGRERAIVHQNARHLVLAERMLLPIVDKGSLNKLSANLGLWVYDALAGVKGEERRDMLSKEETLQAEPMLRKEIIKGGGMYYEYRTDDARLVMGLLKKAAELGALTINYCPCQHFSYTEEGQINGAVVHDELGDQTIKIKARKVVNAAGPWVDELRKEDKSLKGKHLKLSKGVHIVVPYERLPLQQAAYFDVADGRMVFAIPRDEITYIGTTDTFYEGDTNHPIASQKDVDYLLAATNAVFPNAKLEVDDIESSWAGLRPLIGEEGKSAGELSRRDELFESDSGLISIAGGKLTGYRQMAKRTVDLVMKQLGDEHKTPFVACKTAEIKLHGGDFRSEAAYNDFVEEMKGDAEKAELDKAVMMKWVHRYGSDAEKLLEKLQGDTRQESITKTEVDYCMQHEMVHTVSDFLIRRTGMLYFQYPLVESIYPLVNHHIAELLHHTPEQENEQREEFEAYKWRAVNFSKS